MVGFNFKDDETEKYKREPIKLSHEVDEEEVEYERYILNLDSKLIQAIEDYIYKEKRNKKQMRDIKTGRLKTINRSLWAREVFAKALKDLGVNIE